MKTNKKNNVEFLSFESLEKTRTVRHAFSTRIGGVSKGVYAEMNLGFTSGDTTENVLENFKIFCSAVGFNYESVVFSSQVHKTGIYHVKKNDGGKGPLRKSDITETDALITNEPDIVLVTFHADCTPLFFLDSKRKVAALAHAGWRGTVMEIGALTVKEMSRVYGCAPSDILAGIGPCIGKCCFETDEDVYSEFTKRLPFSEEFIIKRSNKYNMDLTEINKRILLNAGLKAENIETADLCTKCDDGLFYSHRLTGNPRGSMAAFIGLER